MGEYTYLVGLLIFGAILFGVGMVFASKEGKEHRSAEPGHTRLAH
jgi:hypothetical protein